MRSAMLRNLSRFLSQTTDLGEMTAPAISQPEQDTSSGDVTLDLRIASIFVVFAAAMLGGVPPLYISSFKNAGHPATLIFRSLSAGVILALALIHVIGDGAKDLEGVSSFPIGGCCVVFGIVVMVILENLSHYFMSSNKNTHSHGHSHAHASEDMAHSDHEAAMPPASAEVCKLKESQLNIHVIDIDVSADSALGAAAEDGHTHTCVAANTVAKCWVSQQTTTQGTLRQQITAYMFELACVVHSFLIGLSLGVTVNGRSQAMSLFVALLFHQCLEGIGLGSVLVQASFSLPKALFMVVTYAATTPIGVAVGIGIASTYDPSSISAMAVQGVFNSISGGLLLYISLVQLIAEDYTRMDIDRPKGLLFRLGSYAALILGAAGMAMLALWA